MSLWLKGLWGTFGTWLKAFNGPCLWACLIVALGAGWAASSVTRAYKDRQVLAERLTTSQMREDIASARAGVLEDARVLQDQLRADTLAAIQRAQEALSGDIANARDRQALESLDRAIQRLHEDVQYACRRLPLPDQYIDGLRIPRPDSP